MADGAKLAFLLLNYVVLQNFVHSELANMIDEDVVTTKAYVFWPNATIPFYIENEHFDHEQSLKIMTALSLFAFKTCLKFAPVMARPEHSDHVLLLENPTGVRKCSIATEPHSVEEPHRVVLGYDCLKSPEIDMMLMKALGFPFEHNRAVRDLYIDVQPENVEPGHLDLFTKDLRLPAELRAIPYDPNSVMHFGERDFSKNGHRTIIFKNRNLRQERFGLSPLDLRKIDVVYGPACRERDRQEKIELCQNYPGVARRKRDAMDAPRSLRVNQEITPPPDIHQAIQNDTEDAGTYTNAIVKELGIDNEIEKFVEHVFKVGAVALTKAKSKLCGNATQEQKEALRSAVSNIEMPENRVLDIIGRVAEYAQNIVQKATANLTEFCLESSSVLNYQRTCPFYEPSRCLKTYRSTKIGSHGFSTQHRPIMQHSTRRPTLFLKNVYEPILRSNNTKESDFSITSEHLTASSVNKNRRKREDEKYESKSDLRMRSTKLIKDSKSIYVPNYRSPSNTSSVDEHVRRKRGAATEATVNITTEKNKKKLSTKVKKNKKAESKKSVKRRFKSQRFRSKKNVTKEYEGGLKERQWDNSGVSMEIAALNRDENRYTGRVGPNVREKIPEASGFQKNRFGRGKENHQERLSEIRSKKLEPYREKISEEDNVKNIEKSSEISSENDPKPVHPKFIEENTMGQEVASKISDYDREREKERPTKKFIEDVVPRGRFREKKDREESEEENDSRAAKKKKSKQRSSKFKGRPEPTVGLPRVVELTKKNKEFYNERKWPDGVVRYIIKDTGDVNLEDVRARLEEVNQILKRKTCTRLEEIGEDEAEEYEDYLVLDNSPDYVTGRVGGKQNFGVVELLKGGQHRQHAAMVAMAMLGFYFEVSRHDRDKYIRVHTRHVRPDKLHHFEKIRSDATFDLPYDYKSATHPAWQFWRQIGRTGISTVATFKEGDPDGSVMRSLGQNRQLLSDLDLVKINSVYGIDCFVKAPSRPLKQDAEDTEDPRTVREKEDAEEDREDDEKEVFSEVEESYE